MVFSNLDDSTILFRCQYVNIRSAITGNSIQDGTASGPWRPALGLPNSFPSFPEHTN